MTGWLFDFALASRPNREVGNFFCGKHLDFFSPTLKYAWKNVCRFSQVLEKAVSQPKGLALGEFLTRILYVVYYMHAWQGQSFHDSTKFAFPK